MKRVLVLATVLFFCSATFAHAYTSPGKVQGFVNDFAHILPAETVTSLNQTLSAFSSQTTIQVVVATVPTLGDETRETYAVQLFEEWGLGKKGKDNGVLMLVAPNEKQIWIEVGYGLEGTLTDAQTYGIIQKIILPYFKNNDYATGIVNGTDAIMSVVASEADYSQQPVKSSGGINWEVFFYIGIFVLLSIVRGLSRTKSWWLGGVIGAVVGIVIGFVYGFIPLGIIAIVILTALGLIIDYIVSKNPPKGPGGGGFWPIFIGGGGSGFGRGSSGGGFGGFGGGSSGGGGAGSSW